MRHRTLASICALVIVVGFFSLTPSRVSAQRFEPDRPKSTDTPYAQKTPWGAPDIQGIWNYPFQAPLQRPAKYKGRERLTAEELDALNDKRSKSIDRDFRPTPGQATGRR